MQKFYANPAKQFSINPDLFQGRKPRKQVSKIFKQSGRGICAITRNAIQSIFQIGSFGYKIYGRTSGNEQFLSIVRNTYFDDIGSITPNGLYPTTNTTGYNPNKINLGKYFYIGSDSNLTYIKAHDLETIKPLQDISGTNKYITVADIVKWSDEINWFFGIRHDTAPRNIGFYSHNKKTNKKTRNSKRNRSRKNYKRRKSIKK